MSFTTEEEETIARMETQFGIRANLLDGGINVDVATPGFDLSFPNPPRPQIGSLNTQAANRSAALDQIEGQLTNEISNAKAAVDAWIAGLDDYHRYFELYQEAFRRAKLRL